MCFATGSNSWIYFRETTQICKDTEAPIDMEMDGGQNATPDG